MAVTVVIPTTLRLFTEHRSEIELEGNTVGEVLTRLADEYPSTKKHFTTRRASSARS